LHATDQETQIINAGINHAGQRIRGGIKHDAGKREWSKEGEGLTSNIAVIIQGAWMPRKNEISFEAAA